MGFPGDSVVKNLPANAGDVQKIRVPSLVQEDPLEKEMATHSSIHAWKSLWTKELVGYSPRGHKESDTTERLHFTSLHFRLERASLVTQLVKNMPAMWES